MEARAYVQEKDLVDQVNEALEELRMNKAELALRMSVSRSMMSQYLNRKYRSDATELEEALRGWLREVHPGTEPAENAAEMGGAERPLQKTDCYESRDYVSVIGICRLCQEEATRGIITGRSGYGKTFSLKKYAQMPRVAYVECNEAMNQKDLIRRLEAALGLPREYGTIAERLERVADFLTTASGYLLIIDGLDGLACGVSAIASLTMLVVSLLVSDANINVAVILAALCGGCLGFIPYNLNPAKIFMGDTGALLLGYVLATVSVIGMFKFYAIVTFVLPVLALAVPLSDTIFAFTRRILHGQSPFHADRGHFHHKLLDMGLSQKQAVAVLYAVSAILGLAAVLLTSTGIIRVVVAVIAFVIAVCIWLFVFRNNNNIHPLPHEKPADESGEADSKNE